MNDICEIMMNISYYIAKSIENVYNKHILKIVFKLFVGFQTGVGGTLLC